MDHSAGVVHTFKTRARIRNRFIRQFTALPMEQPDDDEWAENYRDRVLFAFWDITQNRIYCSSIAVSNANDHGLRTLNSTEARSPPSTGKSGVAADLDNQEEVLRASD